MRSASRMESHGLPGLVHLSAKTFSLLKHPELFKIEPRGDIEVKGLGAMSTFICRGFADDGARAVARQSSGSMRRASLAEVVNVNRRGSGLVLAPSSSMSDLSEARGRGGSSLRRIPPRALPT